jgi:tetratricopeptide (TPR) repeat protein
VTPGSGAGSQAGVNPLDYLLTQGTVILRYLRMLAIPMGFSIDPNIAIASPAKGIACWALIAVFAAIAVRDLGRSRSSIWFLAGLLLLLPTSSIFPANDLAADRRMYLPMIGFAAVAGLLLEKTRYQVLLPAVAIVLGMLSYARADVWRSEASLWEDAMRAAPNKIRPRIQLARAANPRAALDYLLEAKTIAPTDGAVASELGRVYMTLGNPSQALAEFSRVLAANSNDALAHNNRGVALQALDLDEHARNDFRRAIALDPCLFDARLNLALAGEVTTLPAGCRFSPEQLRAYNGR